MPAEPARSSARLQEAGTRARAAFPGVLPARQLRLKKPIRSAFNPTLRPVWPNGARARAVRHALAGHRLGAGVNITRTSTGAVPAGALSLEL